MVIIKTTCPRCGEVDLTAEKVDLRIALGGRGSSYAFDCPRCTDRVRKPADARIAQLLISGGVSPNVVTPEAPAAEPVATDGVGEARPASELRPAASARSSAPTLTYDDLLEFHAELEAGVVEDFLRNHAA